MQQNNTASQLICIDDINDHLRKNPECQKYGKVVYCDSFEALNAFDKVRCVEGMVEFNEFPIDNEPFEYDRHDKGAFTVNLSGGREASLEFKIEYLNKDMTGPSENMYLQSVTSRKLTLTLHSISV